MAGSGVTFTIDGDATGATKAVDQTTRAVKDLPREVDKAERSVSASTRAMADDFERTGREVDDTGSRVGETYEAVGDSALGAASAIGEAFGEGGGAASAMGSFGEVVEAFGGMFGPIGLAVSAAGGFVIGAITGMASKSKEQLEEIRNTASRIVDELIEKQGQLDEAYSEEALRDFVDTNLENVEVMRRLLGPDALPLLQDTLAGSTEAYAQLTAGIEDQIVAMQEEYTALQGRYQAGQKLTDQELRRMNSIPGQISALKGVTSAIEDQVGALDRAYTMNDLLAEAERSRKSALEGGYDAMLKQTRLLYDEAEAARVATENMRRLREQESKRSARGDAPENAVAYVEGKGWVDRSGSVVRGPNRAAGGPVVAGHAYTVGEYGRETFVPATDGTIVPAGATAAASEVHVHLHAAVATPSLIREATPVIVRAVADAQRRGGSPSLRTVYRGGTG